MALGRDDILKAEDLPRELVEVPEWGGAVWIGTMTGAHRDAFELASSKADPANAENRVLDRENMRARLVVFTAQGERGEPLFSPADVASVGRKNAAALDRLFGVAMRINRLGADDLERAKGESEPVPSGGPG